MCDKAILENGGTLSYKVPECYKNRNTCNQAIDIYANVLQFVPDSNNVQKMCNKAVSTSPFEI